MADFLSLVDDTVASVRRFNEHVEGSLKALGNLDERVVGAEQQVKAQAKDLMPRLETLHVSLKHALDAPLGQGATALRKRCVDYRDDITGAASASINATDAYLNTLQSWLQRCDTDLRELKNKYRLCTTDLEDVPGERRSLMLTTTAHLKGAHEQLEAAHDPVSNASASVKQSADRVEAGVTPMADEMTHRQRDLLDTFDSTGADMEKRIPAAVTKLDETFVEQARTVATAGRQMNEDVVQRADAVHGLIDQQIEHLAQQRTALSTDTERLVRDAEISVEVMQAIIGVVERVQQIASHERAAAAQAD